MMQEYPGELSPYSETTVSYDHQCFGDLSPYSEAVASRLHGGSSIHLNRGRSEDAKAMFEQSIPAAEGALLQMALMPSSELPLGQSLNAQLENDDDFYQVRASTSTTAQAPFPHNMLAPWPESLGDLDDDGVVDDSFAGLIPDAVHRGDGRHA